MHWTLISCLLVLMMFVEMTPPSEWIPTDYDSHTMISSDLVVRIKIKLLLIKTWDRLS